ncbi:MAE_28990/MAE_18760 family HEPN-like nuclease [Frateuria sp. YIM B11624]|uniref:MAE_28990/MAE_18760 family HEPN-like nuclease n=1 Tax=Frateuria sp. YIM B11624 TaxID=3143185 RepID=UPI003C75A709
MEADLLWRTDEIRFLQNTLTSVPESDKDKLRRALLLLLYAHFEGFCKFALDSYVRAVNQERVHCSRAAPSLVAATLHEVLHDLKSNKKKSKIFTDHSSEDGALQGFARDVEFVQKSTRVFGRKVNIPESVVQTESNLWAEVLKKNLYRLGLPFDSVDIHRNRINALVLLRNKISHGEFKRGIKEIVYLKIRDSSLTVMEDLMRAVYDAYSSRLFLRDGHRRAGVPPRQRNISPARRLSWV